MKPFSQIIIFILAIFTSMASAYAQSPREQFTQMVEQLQKTPTDNALREKIIKLAQAGKPAPAIPDDVQRRMARGRAAFMGAKSAADYQDAVKEFEQATLAAPWYADAYFNLGVAQDKAENYDASLRNLKFALLAAPDSKDIKALIYEVEYRQEKARPEARAMKQKLVDETLLSHLEGAVFTLPITQNTEFQYRIANGLAVFWTRRITAKGTTCLGSRGYSEDDHSPIGEAQKCAAGTGAGRFAIPLVGRRGEFQEQYSSTMIEIAEDGQSLRVREKWLLRASEAPPDRVYTRRRL